MDSRRIVQDDILRYKKNKLASILTLLGLVFTALYFMLLYSVNNSFLYSIMMGFSIILTLVLLLAAFLTSESVKNYRKTYCIVLLVLAAINILRIFYYPLKGLKEDVFKDAVYFWTKMSSAGIFTFMVIYLVASAACYVAAAVIGYLYATRLEKHQKGVEEGTVDVDEALKQEEEKFIATSKAAEQVATEQSANVAETVSSDSAKEVENTNESKSDIKEEDNSSEEVK